MRISVNRIAFILLVIITVVVLFPLAWMLITSLRTEKDLYSLPMRLLPSRLVLSNYSYILFDKPEFVRYFVNSVVVTCGSVVLILVFAVFGAYPLARIRFPGIPGEWCR